MADRSNKIFAIAMAILLIDLWAEDLSGASVEGFILVAIALNLYGVYSSITKASLKFMSTSLAYVCGIMVLFTFFLPVVAWSLGQAVIGVNPQFTTVVQLHVLGGLISFYAGWSARNEWSEYKVRVEEESRPKDPGLAIT